MWSENSTQIGTLHVQGAGENSAALRLALASILNSADLRPTGVSPSAILIIRSMTDPLPRRLAPWQGVMRADTAWERAVQNSLAEIYRRAARPINGYLPPGADAVLFADEGEMLACLALDISRGEAWRRWWWKVVLRRLSSQSPDSLRMLLCEKALYLPAILHHLSAWGQAATVVKSLSPEQAMTVLSAMTRARGIADFSTAILSKDPSSKEARNFQDLALETHKPERMVSQSGDSSTDKHHYNLRIPTVKAPWERWISERLVLKNLGKKRACLIGLGLSLYYEPAMVRTSNFGRALRRWWVDQEPISIKEFDAIRGRTVVGKDIYYTVDGKTTPSSSLRLSLDYYGTSDGLEKSDETLVSPELSRFKDRIISGIESSQDIEAVAVEQDSLNDKHRTEHTTNRVSKEVFQESVESSARSHHGSLIQENTEAGPEIAAQPEVNVTKKESGLILEDGVDTQLGGVLYLINLMRYLELPACFEGDWSLASQAGAWGVLEVLSRALLGQNSEHLARDPIWKALAELSGREPRELPGKAFRGSDSFRLPLNWLPQFSRGENRVCYWLTNQRRLSLWFEKQYLLVDCPRDESAPEVQVSTELQAYPVNVSLIRLSSGPFNRVPINTLTSPLSKGLNPNLVQWLTFVLPYIRFRLQQAINPEAEKLDIEEVLLLYRGRLYVTPSHVDLVMRLRDISLPVRLAGLDCNPGWMPDFGRVVQFHFQ